MDKSILKAFESLDKLNPEASFLTDASLSNVEDYYDVKSGLKVKSTQTRSQGAQTMVVTTLYKDYQEKEGIMFPMTISQSFGPQSIDFKVSNIVVNPEFADSDFE